MNYDELADEFSAYMGILHKLKPQKNITESFQGEAFVLKYIVFHGGDVLPSEIKNEMDVSTARIATALNNLEKKGLITRQIDKSDRRKILVNVTREGKTAAEKHRDEMKNTTIKILTLLGENDAKELIRIIGRIANLLPKYISPE